MFAHKKYYGRAGYVDDPLPNIVYVALLMLALYGSTMHPTRLLWWFLDHFFPLSVWSSWKKAN